jgi:hypothetical protein
MMRAKFTIQGVINFWLFLAPTPTNRVYDRNFLYARNQLILYNNSQQFGLNRRPKFFRKNHVPFYIIFTSENHLNAHSSLIKQHMAMNFGPLDYPCQGASSESKKIYLNFFILEQIAKNKKSIFLAPTAKNGFNGRNFYYS